MLVARAPQQQVLQPRFEVGPRRFEQRAGRQAQLPLHRVGHALENVSPPAAQIGPATQQFEAALLERFLPILGRDQQRWIERESLTQPVALRAHALGTVEAEQLRAGRFETDAAFAAGVGRRKDDVVAPRAAGRGGQGRVVAGGPFLRCPAAGRPVLVLALHGHDQVALADLQRQFDRFGQPRPNRRFNHQPIDDHLDVVPHLPIQLQVVGQRYHRAVDASADEPLFQQIREQIAVLAFLAADQRGEHAQACTLRQLQDPGENLLPGLSGDGLTAFGAKALAHAGE